MPPASRCDTSSLRRCAWANGDEFTVTYAQTMSLFVRSRVNVVKAPRKSFVGRMPDMWRPMECDDNASS
jgi:hypothetical protein